jgi:hypothetical protein
MKKIRIQDIEIFNEERPRRIQENPKKRGRIQHDEKEFPIKKKDTWIGKNRKDRTRE